MSDNESSNKSGSGSYNIVKLNETNYRAWAKRIEWIFDERGLWEVVTGAETKPVEDVNGKAADPTVDLTASGVASTSAAVTTTPTSDYASKLEAYTKKCKRARSILGVTITDSVMTYIEGENDPAEMWKILESRYNPRTQVTLLQRIREFTTIKMEDDADLERHIQRVVRLRRICEEQGEKISDAIFKGILLNSLPEEYILIVNVIEGQGDLTPDEVINKIMEEYRKRAGNEADEGQKAKVAMKMRKITKSTAAGQSESQNSTAKSSPSSKKRFNCNTCGKPGHSASKCWIKHPELKPKDVPEGCKGQKSFAMTTEVVGDAHEPQAFKTASLPPTHWYLDSGASDHFTPNLHLFGETYKPLARPVPIRTAEGIIYATGKGTVEIAVHADDEINVLQLRNVLYSPTMTANLLSTMRLCDLDYKISMNSTGTTITKDGITVANSVREGSLFRLKTAMNVNAMVSIKDDDDLHLWHRRLGHLGESNVKKTPDITNGIQLDRKSVLGTCGSCQVGKQTRKPSHEPSKKASAPLELVHSDTSGKVEPTAIRGIKYWGTFIDDFTGYTYIYGLKDNTAREFLECFKQFRKETQTRFPGCKIQRLRTDNGTEYLGVFKKYLKQKGILHETTAPYSPDQNGFAERANRVIGERTRAILHDSGLPKDLWMEIASTVVYLKNRSPTRTLSTTPYEAWYRSKPDLSNLRIIGSVGWVHIPIQKTTKLDDRSIECWLVGYGGAANHYRLWNPVRKDVVVTRDVKIDEGRTYLARSSPASPPSRPEVAIVPPESPPTPIAKSTSEIAAVTPAKPVIVHDSITVLRGPPRPNTTTLSGDSEPTEEAESSSEEDATVEDRPNRRPRERRIPSRFMQTATALYVNIEDYDLEPRTYKEAINHPLYGKQWEHETHAEINAIIKNDTWILVPRPRNRNVVTCKWIFKVKRGQNGEIVRLKARLVARGFSQVYGMDYWDTFAPVAKLSSLRLLLAIAAHEDLEIHQMDVVTAFLASDIDEEIYMEQPEGFEVGEAGELVCKLGKGLYGLKQAARLWNRRIRDFLKSMGFTQMQSDHCVYINKDSGVILALWIDDIIMFSSTLTAITTVKNQLRAEFEMKDLGELQYFLGMHVTRDRGSRTIHVDQTNYIQSVLARFDMQNCKGASTPMVQGTKYTRTSVDDELTDQWTYQSEVGSSMYGMLCTRPDIAFSVSQLSQFNAKPSRSHQRGVQRIFQYLQATQDYGITYYGNDDFILKGYSDADHGALEDRRSTSAYVFTLAGGAISWMSKKQPTVALSSTEAEYIALTQAVKESMWIQRFLKEIGRYDGVKDANVIYEDNQGAIALANNPEFHARTKHIDIQYHYVREKVQSGEIDLVYCPTAEMVADQLTKALSPMRHQYLIEKMGIGPVARLQQHLQSPSVAIGKLASANPKRSGNMDPNFR